MHRPVLTLVLLLGLTPPAVAQESESHEPAIGGYAVFTGDGSPADLDEVVSAMNDVDVVFLGEQHNNPTGHQLELFLLRAAYSSYGSARPVVLSLEMFESDVQHVLNEYLAGYIRESDFLKAARPWSNYETDYKPLIEFAKENEIAVMASNAPGRYTSMARRRGLESLDSLSSFARYVLPHDRATGSVSQAVANPSDRLSEKFWEEMQDMDGHGTMPSIAEMLVAQNLRDATMAYWIANKLGPSRPLVIHINGSFHSEDGLGVPEHLGRFAREAETLFVTIRTEEDFHRAPDSSSNDFVIQTDASLIPDEEQ